MKNNILPRLAAIVASITLGAATNNTKADNSGSSKGSSNSSHPAKVSDASPKFTWTRGIIESFDGRFNELHGIATDSSGNVYMAGSFSGTLSFGATNLTHKNPAYDGFYEESFFAKFNPGGNLMWVKQGSGPYDHVLATDVACDKAGNVYFLATSFNSADFGDVGVDNFYGTLILKYDTNGKLVWSRKAGSTEQARIAIDKDGNILISGVMIFGAADFGNGVTLPSIGDYEFVVAKYDSSGNALWVRTQEAMNTGLSQAGDLAVDSNGDVYVTGNFAYSTVIANTPVSSSGADGFIAKYGADGSPKWVKQSLIGQVGVGCSIAIGQDGTVYASGSYSGSGSLGGIALPYTSGGSYVAGLTPDGNVAWAKSINNASVNRIYVDADGRAQIVGGFQSSASFGPTQLTSIGDYNGFLASCAANGDFLSAMSFGGPNDTTGSTVVGDGKGNLYLGGQFAYQAQIGNVGFTSTAGQNIFFSRLLSK